MGKKKNQLTISQKMQMFTHFMMTRKHGDVTKVAEMLHVTPQCVSRIINYKDNMNDKTVKAMYKLTKRRIAYKYMYKALTDNILKSIKFI